MAISKDKKKEIYDKISDILKHSPSVAFVNFHGLGVSQITEMRKTLRDSGIGYFVAKKTLIKRALFGNKISGDTPVLDGEIAIAYTTTLKGDDGLIGPAREVYVFQKKFKDLMAIVGGIFENTYKNKEDMTNIAKIPTTKVLYGQIVQIINSPIQQFAVALNQIADKKS